MIHTTIAALAVLALTVLAPASTAAQVAPEEAPRTVSVNARASVQRAPDWATVQLAVETIAATAREATAGNAAAMDRVLTALRQAGIPAERIRTTRLGLQPRYDQRRDVAEPAIIAYQAVNQVMVRLDDIDLVGRVVDAAVEAGANRVTGIHFELSDPQAAYHEALRLAVARAQAEAAVLADALGEALGPALQVSTGGAQPPRPMIEAITMGRADVAAFETPVQAGELEVHAMVNITYRLGP